MGTLGLRQCSPVGEFMAVESSIRELGPDLGARAPAGQTNANATEGPGVLRFGHFALDLRTGELRCHGCAVELRPCTFQLLAYLAQNAGRVVTRRELFDRLWPEIAVSDGSLTQSIFEVRKALGEAGRQPRLVRTLRGAGYCFTATVRCEAASVSTAQSPLPTVRSIGASPARAPSRRRPARRNGDAALSTDEVAEISRLLQTRAREVTSVEQTQRLVAAYDELVAITQRLGLIDLEIDARLGRAACLLAETELAGAARG
jgi:DNA-binding winged helix-turn-helix (wHTH) protein